MDVRAGVRARIPPRLSALALEPARHIIVTAYIVMALEPARHTIVTAYIVMALEPARHIIVMAYIAMALEPARHIRVRASLYTYRASKRDIQNGNAEGQNSR